MTNETIYECAGCGCSFDLSNEHETDILEKHNKGVYPCETFNIFCENFGSVADCRCGECLDLAEDS
jgi:hypothetical protein